MAKKGIPIKKKRSKINEIFSGVLRIMWGCIGALIIYWVTIECLTSQSCNTVIVGTLCIIGLGFLLAAGLPCHKLVPMLSRG